MKPAKQPNDVESETAAFVAAKKRIEALEAALGHALETKHDIRTCACVKCEDSRAALKEGS